MSNGSWIEQSEPDEAELERFREFLRDCRREWETWPEWKRNTLGWWKREENGHE